MNTVAVTGATGLIGSALTRALRSNGTRVLTIGRGKDSALQWNPGAGALDAAPLEGVDAVVHLAGAPIDVRWTSHAKHEIRESRIGSTQLLARTLASLKHKPTVFVCGSAVGFYGNGGESILTEESPGGSGFLAEVVRDWEAATRAAADAGIRVVNIRTGVVIAGHAGMIGRLLPPFKLGVGGVIGDGSQWMSWISLHDHVRAIQHAMTSSLEGPVNFVSPQPVTNRDFTHAFGRVLSRPTVVPIPEFALRLAFGHMAEETILTSQRAIPACLAASSFAFELPEIEGALRTELGATEK